LILSVSTSFKIWKLGTYCILFDSRTRQTNIGNIPHAKLKRKQKNNDIKSLIFNKLCEIEIFQRWQKNYEKKLSPNFHVFPSVYLLTTHEIFYCLIWFLKYLVGKLIYVFVILWYFLLNKLKLLKHGDLFRNLF
jgi:hypothetical protein